MNDMNDAQTSPIMPNYSMDTQNMVIIGLIVLLILAVLGINLLTASGNILQSITSIFEPLFFNILSLIGYSTGTIINKTADIASDTSKLGIDIAEGTVHSIGDLLKNSSNPNINENTRKSLDDAINNVNRPTPTAPPPTPPPPPAPPAKEHFSTLRSSWDYDGENQLKHGYIDVGDYGKSISGQIFPANTMIMQPLLFEQR